MAAKICVFNDDGEVVQFGPRTFFYSYDSALEAIRDNTGQFHNGQKLAIVNFEDHICYFVEMRMEMTVIELE